MLDLARLEAGRYDIYADLISLTDLAAEAVHFMKDEASRKALSWNWPGRTMSKRSRIQGRAANRAEPHF